MPIFFSYFFQSNGFIPHGHCYLWQTGLVWLHIISDATIAFAYYSIPFLLIYFISKRKDVPFNGVFLLFGAFIIACGTGHLIDIWTLWHPDYWVAGALKALTAIISIYTAFALFYLMPQALTLPSPAQLEAINKVLSTEIVERKRIEKELRLAEEVAQNSNQAKSEFLANMSHELRTPLNGILGYTQIIQRTESLSEKGRKGLGVIYQCGSHLLTLINDVLDLSKIEARKLELYPIDFYFPAFIDSVTEICRIRAEQKVIAFHVELDPNLPTGIHADEKRLRQVLINLLSNAMKFTHKGSVTFKVQVISQESNANGKINYKIRFQVVDTGTGITPEQAEKIFQPFEQVGSQKRQSEGTGLGLAISQKIVLLMGGQIQVQSEFGKGSTFWFEAKLLESKDWAKVSRVVEEGTIIGYQGQRRTILIADDKWENRSVIVNLLEPVGFTVVEASNGQEAWAQSLAHKPDTIVTDLVMPILDGFEFINRLRQSEQFKEIPVIASSASVFAVDQHKSIDVGADAFLPKPVEAETLLEMLRQFMQLEWIFDVKLEAIAKISTGGFEEQTEMIYPAQEVLQELLELAQDGDIQNILEMVEQLSVSDERLNTFVQKIIQLASNFQLKRLESFIEEYIN
ncbi:hybrid sensor histidine kinase/response regulator [Nostoc sp. 'Peltigera membranacea cyanobiont' 213]|uniref:ATP-binding protein n=1 Tax=unclassified Nostoc TaxID=2593658 RepID=UPI000B953E01|nr:MULTISPECIES: ATP-binding protein [unclassified Nostoc]AVH62472.1 integral membrane sensor hybrid histidine kinase [Nostoc sp. 'Peltigera membranacea cyanobiont' N6]OYD99248.1 hybrid sensor histidine kinase/response regulator [Nostoc sp. 'Peltigera membranacea cyanobiont' 213]